MEKKYDMGKEFDLYQDRQSKLLNQQRREYMWYGITPQIEYKKPTKEEVQDYGTANIINMTEGQVINLFTYGKDKR